MEYSELIAQRFSCRSFSDRPVEEEKLEKIIRAGILAPTAKDLQPLRIFRLESQEAKEAVRAVTPCHFGAETFLLVGADPEESFRRPFDGHNYSDVDAAIVATHMMLEIHNQGLRTTWVGYFDAPRLKQLLPGLAGYELLALFPIGYASEDGVPGPKHNLRKPVTELVVNL